MWEKGQVIVRDGCYPWEAKVYEEGSKYGIDGGPISKLYVWYETEDDAELIIIYDRGWTTPKPPERSQDMEVLKAVLSAIEANRMTKKKGENV